MAVHGYESADRICDCIWLLTTIKGILFKFEGQKEIFHANIEARHHLDCLKQKEGKSTNSFLEQFQATIEAFEHYGGSIGTDKGLVKAVRAEMRSDEDPGDYPRTTNDANELRARIKKERNFTQLGRR